MGNGNDQQGTAIIIKIFWRGTRIYANGTLIKENGPQADEDGEQQ